MHSRVLVAGLEPVAHFPLLSAVSGILVGLTLRGSQESRDTAAKAIVSDASFVTCNIISLARSKLDDASSSSSAKRAFQLADHTDYVSEDEVSQLQEMVNVLIMHSKQLESSSACEEIPEDEMCTICYATKKTAIFEPCGHRSCRCVA